VRFEISKGAPGRRAFRGGQAGRANDPAAGDGRTAPESGNGKADGSEPLLSRPTEPRPGSREHHRRSTSRARSSRTYCRARLPRMANASKRRVLQGELSPAPKG
jgi:hypothetical protein